MRFDSFFKRLAPVAAIALATGLSACNADIQFGEADGVPLSELDLTGDAPTALTLLGPDRVLIKQGDTLAVSVEGDDDGLLRFAREDGMLAITRDDFNWKGDGAATVTVTMPAPGQLVLAGSGSITSETLAEKADVTIAGSGSIEAQSVKAKSLDVNVAGSGSFTAGGSADELDLNIAGSGDAKMPGLKVGSADVSIAGSGDSEFASDGEVNVSIFGSGDLTVYGSARCKVSTMGSGTVTCQNTEAASSDEEAAGE